MRNVETDPRITVMIFASPYEFCEVRGHVVEIVKGAEARNHIDELARKYTGADYTNPIGPGGRVILKIKPDKENVVRLSAQLERADGLRAPVRPK